MKHGLLLVGLALLLGSAVCFAESDEPLIAPAKEVPDTTLLQGKPKRVKHIVPVRAKGAKKTEAPAPTNPAGK